MPWWINPASDYQERAEEIESWYSEPDRKRKLDANIKDALKKARRRGITNEFQLEKIFKEELEKKIYADGGDKDAAFLARVGDPVDFAAYTQGYDNREEFMKAQILGESALFKAMDEEGFSGAKTKADPIVSHIKDYDDDERVEILSNKAREFAIRKNASPKEHTAMIDTYVPEATLDSESGVYTEQILPAIHTARKNINKREKAGGIITVKYQQRQFQAAFKEEGLDADDAELNARIAQRAWTGYYDQNGAVITTEKRRSFNNRQRARLERKQNQKYLDDALDVLDRYEQESTE